MLAHLLVTEPEPLEGGAAAFVDDDSASPEQLIDAKNASVEWLKQLDNALFIPDTAVPTDVEDWINALKKHEKEIDPAIERQMARETFGAMTGLRTQAMIPSVKDQVLTLRTAESVKTTIQMLSAYEWEFVEQAKQIRGYIVDGLIQETKNPVAAIRLKAYKMLGDVTEVALFTQRVEVNTSKMSDRELEEEIQNRLDRLTFDAEVVERVDTDSPAHQ